MADQPFVQQGQVGFAGFLVDLREQYGRLLVDELRPDRLALPFVEDRQQQRLALGRVVPRQQESFELVGAARLAPEVVQRRPGNQRPRGRLEPKIAEQVAQLLDRDRAEQSGVAAGVVGDRLLEAEGPQYAPRLFRQQPLPQRRKAGRQFQVHAHWGAGRGRRLLPFRQKLKNPHVPLAQQQPHLVGRDRPAHAVIGGVLRLVVGRLVVLGPHETGVLEIAIHLDVLLDALIAEGADLVANGHVVGGRRRRGRREPGSIGAPRQGGGRDQQQSAQHGYTYWASGRRQPADGSSRRRQRFSSAG